MTSVAPRSKEAGSPVTDDMLKSSWARNVLLSLLLVFATALLYYPVHRQPFSGYDDPAYVTSNAHLKYGLDWDAAKWAFTAVTPEWHPLTWLSHGLDAHLFSLNQSRHHDMNVLLHAVNVALLFWVLVQATGHAGRSLMVAAYSPCIPSMSNP